MTTVFKRGSQYTRDDIANLVRPENPPHGGDWATGYARIDDNLYVFMNIGVAGRTGHDFENYYDEKTNTLIWFSKPNKRSTNPLFEKLISGVLTPYFFARWNQRPPFTFLGTGSVLKFEDGYKTPQGYECIRLVVSVADLQEIVSPYQRILRTGEDLLAETERSSFFFEKQLEDFLVTNWDRTPLAKDYEIFAKDGQICGQQYRTSTGPIDILGQRKDKSDFLVVELKRDRASDVVVGQTLRYMGWVKENLCSPSQRVTGCIIAQRKDEKLDYALKHVDSIRFLRYEVDFRLLS
jgi:hypothetical protein